MTKLPIDIRRNFSIKRQPHHLDATCDQCGRKLSVAKNDVSMLSYHLLTHDADWYPFNYTVAQYADGSYEVARMPEMHLGKEPVVQHLNGGFFIQLRATNQKHALVLAEGIVSKMRQKKSDKRHWKNNP